MFSGIITSMPSGPGVEFWNHYNSALGAALGITYGKTYSLGFKSNVTMITFFHFVSLTRQQR
jgi:hypothetical protein